MRTRVVAFGALGTLVTLVAAAIVFAPEVVAGVEPVTGVADALDEVDTRQLLLVASGVVGAALSVAGWRASQSARASEDEFEAATAEPPESVTAARHRLTAANLDDEFDAAIAGDEAAIGRVRDRLSETAIRAYAHANECERATARTAVDRGTWTDDRTAAASLAGDDGPTYSLTSRLRLWLDPESERDRRFDRTVRATVELAGRSSLSATTLPGSSASHSDGAERTPSSRGSPASHSDGGDR